MDTALNGREAVDKVTRNRYSLVLMDCQMPEMDGFQATQQIRALEEPIQRHTPIIAMTAQTTAEDRVRCLESGMDDYISKPVTLKKLRKVILKWAPSKHLVQDSTTAAPATTEQDKDALIGVILAWTEAFGAEIARELLVEVMNSFKTELELVQLHLSNDDWLSAQGAAHKLKGLCLNFHHGDNDTSPGEQLEHHLKTGDLQSTKKMIDSLILKYLQYKHTLDEHYQDRN